ncbi:asparagine synthase (glutamine-hydrolyzing) [Auritidibacter sp. NML100628]|nr:asparagine synthase (glutamine-hydrolyzing) [Auritidibacter sp. NML100628]
MDRLNGIFAFSIWDTESKTAWLVRDPLGVKPLHYHAAGEALVFGSEIKSLLAHPTISSDIDDAGMRQLLLPLLKFPGENPYRDIQEVLPGHILEFSPRGVRHTQYWNLAEILGRPNTTENPEEAASALSALLQDTVTRQTIADVPLCTFLSGGLDSSAVTAIANSLRNTEPVSSFSVDFSDVSGSLDSRSAQDRRYAHEAAAYIGSRHHNIVLDSTRLAESSVRDAALRARDLPNGFGDLETSLLLLCREVRRHATVALSGEGADEILGGYRWFNEPDAVWSDTFPWMADTPAHGHLHQRVLATLRPDLVSKLELNTRLHDEYSTALNRLELDPDLSEADRRHREISYLAITYFLPMLLDRNDRLSMASGLEVRVPFCDPRIVELVATLPRNIHNSGGREKGVLRDAIGERLPESVRERTKSPYPTTPDPEYSRILEADLENALAEPPAQLAEIFRPEVLHPDNATTSARHQGLVSNFESEVILNFTSWFRQYEPNLPSH